jgi:N-acyl amino acid synthase of PEP-CTERM/exosortase system
MPTAAITDVTSHYDKYFVVARATTAAHLEQVYRLRYQVYCIENAFEDPARQQGEYETDEDDDRSVHVLLLHRRTGEAVGTSRVILPHQTSLRPLPIARLLSGRARRRFDEFPAHQIAEVSRFAVSKQFRRRHGEECYADIAFGNGDAEAVANERRLMPNITLGLLRGVFGICLEHEVTYIAAVMEPPLIRILRRLSLDFEPIGELIEHHGLRQPCIARLADLIWHSHESASLMWQYAGADLPAELGIAVAAAGADLSAREGNAYSPLAGADKRR